MMQKVKEIHDYWKHSAENPLVYAKQIERSELLASRLPEDLDSSSSFLEIGCNIGRNLNHLSGLGYKNLTGIEINSHAVNLMEKTYPDVFEDSRIYNYPVEKVIRSFQSRSFDVVFTMAVLQHIHPDSEWVFPEMERITKKYLITIENESANNFNHKPRNYKHYFPGVNQIDLWENIEFDKDGLGKGTKSEHIFNMRIFKK